MIYQIADNSARWLSSEDDDCKPQLCDSFTSDLLLVGINQTEIFAGKEGNYYWLFTVKELTE